MQFVFNNGQMDLDRLKDLVNVVGKKRLVLDLSCRKKVNFHMTSLFLFPSYLAVFCLEKRHIALSET